MSGAQERFEMDTLYLKACPKCMGDVVVDNDPYGWFFKCLQCGMLRDLAAEPAAGAPDTMVEVMIEEEMETAYL